MTTAKFLDTIAAVFRETKRFPDTHRFWISVNAAADYLAANPDARQIDIYADPNKPLSIGFIRFKMSWLQRELGRRGAPSDVITHLGAVRSFVGEAR